MTTRTDIHKPSLLDPAEYEFEAAFYQGNSEDMADMYVGEGKYYDAAISNPAYQVFNGNHAEKETCDHCGAAFNHGALFRHVPTGDLIHVGHICADDTIGLPSRAVAARRQAEKHAAAMKELRLNQAYALENFPEAAEYLLSLDLDEQRSDFLFDVARRFRHKGYLSERQAEAVLKFKENAEKYEQRRQEREQQEEIVPEKPLEEGRLELTGKVVHTRAQDSQFGTTIKMLVVLEDGNKVWGTVPEALFRAYADTGRNDGVKGSVIKFRGTVERSEDDEHFGFLKRPHLIALLDVDESIG